MKTATLVGFILALAAAVATAGASPQTIEVRAGLRHASPEVEGTISFGWPADGGTRKLRLLLFANRFSKRPEWTDLSRHFLLAGQTWKPGSTEILSAEADGRALRFEAEPVPGVPNGTVVTAEVEPNAGPIEVTIRFRTVLPNLHDVFGAGRGGWVAIDGWHPLLLSSEMSAEEALSSGPLRAEVRYVVEAPEEGEAMAGARTLSVRETAEITSDRLPLAVAREGFRVEEGPGTGNVRIVTLREPEIRSRQSHFPSPEEAVAETLQGLGVSDVTILRAPLRWIPSASDESLVIVSDRLFAIHPELRPLHRRELAYAVFLREELRRARERERPEDVRWVAEGIAWRRAEEAYRQIFASRREVRDWIRMLDVFAIVDRFETAPRVPFVRAFFPVLASDDPLAIRIESLGSAKPPGRRVFSKLEGWLRPESFARVLDRYASGSGSLRDALRAERGPEAESFLDEWLRPWPRVNYGIEHVGDDGTVRIRRDGEPRADAIEVEVGDDGERSFVDLDQPLMEIRTPPGTRVRLDPERRETERRLDDNERPARFHFLLDSTDVEVSSTEFGFSALLVGRRRYDYRRDVAAAGFYTNRSVGGNVGFQLHGGAAIDDNLYRHNLFGYYTLQELDRDFRNESEPGVRTGGRIGGFGFRYNYFGAFWFENPSNARHVRIFFDAYDRATGSDFDYVQTGGSVSLAAPLREDVVLATQVLNGFTVSTGRGPIPNQGLFSLGGFRSIRGIGAEEELAENILIVRGELRYLLPIRLDLDLEEFLFARRLQLRAYVDAGRVDDRRDHVYDPKGFAVGVGGGVNLFYDFMGFFPSSFYFDVAARVDDTDAPQILFGARQPF